MIKNYMDNLIKKVPIDNSRDIPYSPNSINNRYANIDNAFDRVKISNIKYDQIVRTDKPIYGYKCQLCNGSMGYHLSVQNRDPHDFIRSEYTLLSSQEHGPYYEGGIPFLN